MKRIFALSIIVGIIICAVCATSFTAERTIGHFTPENQTGNDISYDRAVGDLPTEDPTDTITETEPEETRIVETRVVETPTTDETVGEDETTPESTEPETTIETTAETTTETTATTDSVPPVDNPNKPHAVPTGDNTILFVGIGMLAIALTLVIVTARKRTRSFEK